MQRSWRWRICCSRWPRQLQFPVVAIACFLARWSGGSRPASAVGYIYQEASKRRMAMAQPQWGQRQDLQAGVSRTVRVAGGWQHAPLGGAVTWWRAEFRGRPSGGSPLPMFRATISVQIVYKNLFVDRSRRACLFEAFVLEPMKPGAAGSFVRSQLHGLMCT